VLPQSSSRTWSLRHATLSNIAYSLQPDVSFRTKHLTLGHDLHVKLLFNSSSVTNPYLARVGPASARKIAFCSGVQSFHGSERF
jgi:hypothetical protein